MMSDSTKNDDRAGVRVLRRLHPAWSERRIGREIGRTPKFVKKWLERDDSKSLPRGITRTNSVVTEQFKKKVKRKMVGSLKAKGGGKRRKLSIREIYRTLNHKFLYFWLRCVNFFVNYSICIVNYSNCIWFSSLFSIAGASRAFVSVFVGDSCICGSL